MIAIFHGKYHFWYISTNHFKPSIICKCSMKFMKKPASSLLASILLSNGQNRNVIYSSCSSYLLYTFNRRILDRFSPFPYLQGSLWIRNKSKVAFPSNIDGLPHLLWKTNFPNKTNSRWIMVTESLFENSRLIPHLAENW